MSIARLLPGLGLQPVVIEVPDAKTRGDVKWALDKVKSKTLRIQTRDAYYNGDHQLAYATKDWRSEFGKMLKAFNANYCPSVVDTLADRLRLKGIDVNRGKDVWDEANDALNLVWQRNRMDRRAGAIHTSMLKHGEVYVTVWPHPDTEEITYYPSRGDRVAVRYSSESPDQIEVAAKLWMEDKRARLTLYYPDHIERWATRQNSIYNGLPSTDNSFEPLGDDWWSDHDFGVVPVVPFLNDPTEDGIGKSELDNVIPLQDALNIAMADMLVALEFAAYPQRWGVGLIEQRDPLTGEVLQAVKAGIERLWTSDSADTKFGQFDTASMQNFVAAQDAIRADIARVSRTPVHYLLMSGTAPSGESLRVMESPLMAKVKDRQDSTSTSWEEVARLTLIEQGTVNPQDRDTLFRARWEDTSTRNELDLAKAVQLRGQLGVTRHQRLRELGYEESLITEMLDEAEAEAGDVATAAMTGFNAGNLTGF